MPAESKQLQPGVYACADGAIHVDLVELCLLRGIEPTSENQNRLGAEIEAEMRAAHPAVSVEHRSESSPAKPSIPLTEVLAPERTAGVRLIQCLCPARHCIVAVPYQADVVGRDEAVASLHRFLDCQHIPRKCRICGSQTLHLEDAPTRFAKLDEALPHFAREAIANAITREMIDRQRRAQTN